MVQKRIEEITLGQPRKVNGKIFLSDYDKNWPGEYQKQKELIELALKEKILLLEHVGSTSVPGLMAKPIIDIVLEVADTIDEVAYVGPLEDGGFRLHIREDDWFKHRVFKSKTNHVNLHVFPENCSETKRMIDFRNHLIKNRDDFELYLSTKRSLANQEWEYVQDYADAKSDVVKDIFSRIC